MLGFGGRPEHPPSGTVNRQRTASPPWRTVRSAAVFAYTPSTQNTHQRPPSPFREPLIESMKTAEYGGDQFDHCRAKWRVRAASRRKRNPVLLRLSFTEYRIVHVSPSIVIAIGIPLSKAG